MRYITIAVSSPCYVIIIVKWSGITVAGSKINARNKIHLNKLKLMNDYGILLQVKFIVIKYESRKILPPKVNWLFI